MSESTNRRVGNWYGEGKEAKDWIDECILVCAPGLCLAGDLRQHDPAVSLLWQQRASYFSINSHWSLVGYVNLETNSLAFGFSSKKKNLKWRLLGGVVRLACTGAMPAAELLPISCLSPGDLEAWSHGNVWRIILSSFILLLGKPESVPRSFCLLQDVMEAWNWTKNNSSIRTETFFHEKVAFFLHLDGQWTIWARSSHFFVPWVT